MARLAATSRRSIRAVRLQAHPAKLTSLESPTLEPAPPAPRWRRRREVCLRGGLVRSACRVRSARFACGPRPCGRLKPRRPRPSRSDGRCPRACHRFCLARTTHQAERPQPPARHGPRVGICCPAPAKERVSGATPRPLVRRSAACVRMPSTGTMLVMPLATRAMRVLRHVSSARTAAKGATNLVVEHVVLERARRAPSRRSVATVWCASAGRRGQTGSIGVRMPSRSSIAWAASRQRSSR
jgi:hypothetical protein